VVCVRSYKFSAIRISSLNILLSPISIELGTKMCILVIHHGEL
jgi:hypothetical protein